MVAIVLHDVSFLSSIRYLLFQIQFSVSIGLAWTFQEYQRFLRTDKNYKFCINFLKMLFSILKIKPIFGDFIIRYRFTMLLNSHRS